MKEKTDANPIKTAFDDTLKEGGFHKKSGTWYLEKEEMVLVANLQKSQWGQQYYINLGIYLKRLGTNKFPKENECHIRVRASSIFPSDKHVLDNVLDLENVTLKSDDRYEKIRSIIKESLIPFLLRCGSLSGIKEVLQEGQLSNAMVRKEVKNLLSES